MVEQTDQLRGKEIQNIVFLSLSFFFVFTSYQAIQNLQSSLNQEENLGIISLSVLYGCLIISGILAPVVIGRVGLKKAFLAAWTAHVVYTASNFYPSFYTLIPSSVLLGAVSGFLWTAQSTYLSICAYSKSGSSGSKSYRVLSRMNGIFFMIFQSTQITGNLTSSFVLQQGGYTSHGNETRSCGSGDCSSVMGNSTTIVPPDQHVVYVLLGTFLACTVVGLVITLLFLQPIPTSECNSIKSSKASMTSCVSLLFKGRLIFLIPLYVYQATHLTLVWADFTKSYVSCPLGVRMVGFVMATCGGATVLSTLVVGCLASYCGRLALVTLAGVLNAATLAYMYVWHPTSGDDVVIFVIAILWGMSDGIWETQINSLTALFFPDQMEAAFANMNTWKGIGFTLTFVFGNFLCVHVKLLITLSILVLAISLYCGLEVHVILRTRSADIDTRVAPSGHGISTISLRLHRVVNNENNPVC